jgi:hypothetical protein
MKAHIRTIGQVVMGNSRELGRLERVSPREVWSHEAHDLTPWLLENEDVLADALQIDLELSAAEHPVGSFSLDLIGRDLTNDCVLIVENQLEATDHSHLGQLITYAAGTDAGTVVWLSPVIREEHRQALDLLNDLGGDRVRFFALELRVVRIGDSSAAPLLELRAQPNDWHSRISASARATSQGTGKSALYQQFWLAFVERVREQYADWTRSRAPAPANWFSMPCPFKGNSSYIASFAQGDRLRTELYIDYADQDEVDRLFSALKAEQNTIESVYGATLSWEDLPERRASRIAAYSEGDVTKTERHDDYIAWFLDSGHRLRKAVDAVVDKVARAAER